MKNIFFGGVILATCLIAGPALAETLESEISGLLETHPKLRSARNKIDEAKEGINRRLADYFPKVNVTGDYGRQVTDNPTLRANNLSPLATKAGSAQLTVSQNLFKGFRSQSRYARAKITHELAGIALTSAEQNLLFDGASAYLNVIRRKKLMDLAAKNEQIIRDQLVLEDVRVERGSGVSVDVLFAKARLQIATERRLVYEGEYLTSLATYGQVFGNPPKVDKLEMPKVPFDLLPASLEQAHATALAENPTIKDSERTVDLTEEGIRLSQSPYYPRFDLVGTGNIETDYDGVDGLRRDVELMMEMSWDIFTGLSTPAETRAARKRHEASINDRDEVRREIREEVQQGWDRLNTAKKRGELLKNAVNIAAEVHAARVKLAEAGKETIINVLDAQSEVFAAQIEATDAEFDTYVAVYRLLLATGRLNPGVFIAGK